MRSSEVAERAGIGVQTLRYYERRGIVAEPPRSASGYRAYPAEAVDVVRFVKRSQGLGFSLDEVRELLDLAAGGPDGCEPARALAQARITELDRKIAELQRMRNSLAELVDTCDRPPTERSCPLLRERPTDPGEPTS